MPSLSAGTPSMTSSRSTVSPSLALWSRGVKSRTRQRKPGDVLVLTKPIGTGVVTTALKNGKVVDDVLDAAVDSMLRLNRGPAEAMMSAGANAATDITGFGIVGHLMTMMKASGTTGRLRRSALPILPGVLELLSDGAWRPAARFETLNQARAASNGTMKSRRSTGF